MIQKNVHIKDINLSLFILFFLLFYVTLKPKVIALLAIIWTHVDLIIWATTLLLTHG